MMSVFTVCLLLSCLRDITLGFHVDSGLMSGFHSPEPGPHLGLICLATGNNDSIISNLVPGVKYGKHFWLFSPLNSIPRTSLQQVLFFLLVINSEFPSQEDQRSENSCRLSFFFNVIPKLFVSPICSHSSRTRSGVQYICDVINGCRALWRPEPSG